MTQHCSQNQHHVKHSLLHIREASGSSNVQGRAVMHAIDECAFPNGNGIFVIKRKGVFNNDSYPHRY
jgi:hypothetical protein